MFYKIGDTFLIDRTMVHGMADLVKLVSQGLRSWQSGYIYHYIGIFIFFLMALISVVYWQIWAL